MTILEETRLLLQGIVGETQMDKVAKAAKVTRRWLYRVRGAYVKGPDVEKVERVNKALGGSLATGKRMRAPRRKTDQAVSDIVSAACKIKKAERRKR